MSCRTRRNRPLRLPAVAAALLLAPTLAVAFNPRETATDLERAAFTAPELSFGVEHRRLADSPQAVPRAEGWDDFFARYGQDVEVYLDARSGVPANVVAVGNASGFVEPLEATALGVIAMQSRLLAESLYASDRQPRPTQAAMFNRFHTMNWDAIRGFLAIHYKFNTRLDTPFWRHCRAETDLAGGAPIAEFFKENGPGDWRVSMRSKGNINVNAVAREFGGGGHTNASGCSARGEFADLKALFEAKLTAAIEDGK